jgi:lipid-binding SYLF domain-containing protein
MGPGLFEANRKCLLRLGSVVLGLFFLSVIFTLPSHSQDKTKAEKIDASVNETLKRFYAQVKDGRKVAERANGMLVLPNVSKGALIIGAEYGRGALLVGGKTVDYYSMISGSIGLQIGGQSKDIVICFNNEHALKKFRTAKGWEAGVDGNVALFTIGGGQNTLSAMNENPILAFIFDVKGLIADMSIKGAKFSKLDMTEKKE